MKVLFLLSLPYFPTIPDILTYEWIYIHSRPAVKSICTKSQDSSHFTSYFPLYLCLPDFPLTNNPNESNLPMSSSHSKGLKLHLCNFSIVLLCRTLCSNTWTTSSFLFPQKSLEIPKWQEYWQFRKEEYILSCPLCPVLWTLRFSSAHNIFTKGMMIKYPSDTQKLWHQRFFHIVSYLLENKMSQLAVLVTSWNLSSGLPSLSQFLYQQLTSLNVNTSV